MVLTAAHCVTERDTTSVLDPQEIRITAGSLEREGTDAVSSEVAKVVVHDGYTLPLWDFGIPPANDVALVFLKKPLDGVTPAAVDTLGGHLEGTSGTFAGWGYMTPTERSKTLRSVELQTVSDEACADVLEVELADHTACVGPTSDDEVQSAGHEDSGGPLLMTAQAMTGSGEPTPTVIAMSSWGNFPPKGQDPSVFTLVAPYTDWIQKAAAEG